MLHADEGRWARAHHVGGEGLIAWLLVVLPPQCHDIVQVDLALDFAGSENMELESGGLTCTVRQSAPHLPHTILRRAACRRGLWLAS